MVVCHDAMRFSADQLGLIERQSNRSKQLIRVLACARKAAVRNKAVEPLGVRCGLAVHSIEQDGQTTVIQYSELRLSGVIELYAHNRCFLAVNIKINRFHPKYSLICCKRVHRMSMQ